MLTVTVEPEASPEGASAQSTELNWSVLVGPCEPIVSVSPPAVPPETVLVTPPNPAQMTTTAPLGTTAVVVKVIVVASPAAGVAFPIVTGVPAAI